jgi:hypothetical protein
VLLYLGIVVAFESMIGFIQPAGGSTLVLRTFDPDGTPHDRVVASRDRRQTTCPRTTGPAPGTVALRNPDVQATIDGTKGNYRAVPVTGAEHERRA